MHHENFSHRWCRIHRQPHHCRPINPDLFNLGIGEGLTVLEMIKAFERVSGIKLNYELGDRRAGDVMAVYADRSRATRELGWNPSRGVDEIMASAWEWEQQLH